jgi:hypothetical protein
MFNFVPLPVIMSPGFWSAAHGPSHFAEIVMALLAPPSLCEVTFIVYADSKLPVITACDVEGLPPTVQVQSMVITFPDR